MELIDKGLTRNEAYDKVQKAAFNAKKENLAFKEALLKDDGIRSILSASEIEGMFDFRYHTKNVDRIFRKVGI